MSKLKFHVIYRSSEETGYPADELNVHGPSTKGWQSAKFSTYPQEIGLELDCYEEARITSIQLLSHQNKISSKIEIFIGTPAPGARVGAGLEGYEAAQFKRLGYMTLETNEQSNYQARELKTVYIDNNTRYVKFVFHKNYPNSYNYYNQVGVIAINLVGQELTQQPPSLGSNGGMESGGIRGPMKPTVNNPLNDLAIDMNLDPQTTQKLRGLSEAKLRAVEIEDYITAKKIKGIENDLKDLGTRLAQLEIAKRKAVENEDYDQAKDLKDNCDDIREQIEAKIRSVNIPGVSDTRPAYTKQANTPNYNPSWKAMEKDNGYETPRGGMDEYPTPKSHHHGASSKHVSPVPRGGGNQPTAATYDDYEEEAESHRAQSNQEILDGDDRPIQPKAQMSYNDADLDSGIEESSSSAASQATSFPRGHHPLEGVDNYAELPSPEDLTIKAKELADQGIHSLLGEYRTKCLFSKTWTLRLACINKIDLMFDDLIQDRPLQSILPVMALILKLGVDDKMQQVFLDTIPLYEHVLKAMKGNRINKTQIGPIFDPIYLSLIERLSDSNARIKDGAKKLMDSLLHFPAIGSAAVASFAVKSLNTKQQGNWRVILSRLKLLQDMIAINGINNGGGGLTVDSVMSFAKNLSTFTHSNGEVREATKELTIAVYRLVGNGPLQPYLSELRKKQLEEYEEAFAKAADGDGGSDSVMPTPRRTDNESKTAPNSMAKKPAAQQPPPPAGNKQPTNGKQQPSQKQPPQQSQQSKESYDEEDHDHEHGDGDREDFTTCMFCGSSNPQWNEDELDIHFWKSCPLLIPCPACTQVVEIAALPEHLLDECEHKDNYLACDVTGLAVPRNEMAAWQRSRNCKPPPENCIYCPLCLSSVEDSDEAWREHLTQGCPKNARIQR